MAPQAPILPTPPELAAYLRAQDPNAQIRPGLLSNPLAHTNWRTVAHRRLVDLLPDPRAARETPSVAHLETALAELLFTHHINVLIINGGDGTIHQTLNALIALIDRLNRAFAPTRLPLPLFLFVNGGGMNMLARVFGTRGHPVATLKHLLQRARGARLGSLPKRGVPLLAAHPPEAPEQARFGTIFGSELVFNALTMYERFGQGYLGLTRLLAEASVGYAFRTGLWHRFGHLLDAPTTPLTVDGVTYPSYTAAVATTVPLSLAHGTIAAISRVAAPCAMNVIAVLPTDQGQVLAAIPALMTGQPREGILRQAEVRSLTVHGSFTLDGERFDHRSPATTPAPLTVCATSRIIWGITP